MPKRIREIETKLTRLENLLEKLVEVQTRFFESILSPGNLKSNSVQKPGATPGNYIT